MTFLSLNPAGVEMMGELIRIRLRRYDTGDRDGGNTTSSEINLDVVDLGEGLKGLGHAFRAVPAGQAGDLVARGGPSC